MMPVRSKIAFAARVLVIGAILACWGLRAQQSAEPGAESIVLGLLIEDSTLVEGRYGAEYAVKEINEKGGIDGRPLLLSVKSMEGPWGVGSTQAVSLVFDEKARALVGLLDGRNSHLVEQVAAKTDVPFISAWAADPTLSKAYVPQFFNCVPNSEQQGRDVLKDLNEKQLSGKWILVSDDSYDARIAVEGLKNIDGYQKTPHAGHLKCKSPEDFEVLIKHLSEKNPKALVVYCKPELALELVRFLRSSGKGLPIYTNLNLLHERAYPHLMSDHLKELYVVGAGGWMNDRDSDFVRGFHGRFGRNPGAMASYAYDAIHIVAGALIRSGSDPNLLKQSLSKTSFEGRTGHLEFDRFGNRKSRRESGGPQSSILFVPNP